MADVRTSFPVLEVSSTGAGVPLHNAVEGEAVSGKNALGAFVAKLSGNFAYINLNADGSVPVAPSSTGQACLSDEGGVVGSTSYQSLASIALVNEAVYKRVGFMGSCFRDAVFEVRQIDDTGGTPVTTVLATFRVGAGEFTHSEEFECLEFTAGATGDCVLEIWGKQLQSTPSDIDGFISAFEQQ